MVRFSHLLLPLLLVCSLPAQAADREVYVKRERAVYLERGNWSVETNLSSQGMLSYVLRGTDTTQSVAVEFWCQPALEGTGLKIVGPYERFGYSNETGVIYSIDGQPARQIFGTAYAPSEIAFARDKSGVSSLWLSLTNARRWFRVAAQGVPADISMTGFSRAQFTWRRFCKGPMLAPRFLP